MSIEHKVKGDRSARIRLDQGGWNTGKNLAQNASEQFLWIALALWTGFTFVGYFVPIRELGGELLRRSKAAAADFLGVVLRFCDVWQSGLHA